MSSEKTVVSIGTLDWYKDRCNDLEAHVAKYICRTLAAEAHVAQLRAEIAKDKWISVEDHLPDSADSGYTQEYLCLDKSGNRLICIGRYSATKSGDFYWIGNYERSVTHWRPLPAPPAERDAQEGR